MPTSSIWKYIIHPETAQTILMPREAVPLTVAPQGQSIAMWAEIPDTEAEHISRVFYVIGTGEELPDDARFYVGTFQMGAYVFHVYEAKR